MVWSVSTLTSTTPNVYEMRGWFQYQLIPIPLDSQVKIFSEKNLTMFIQVFLPFKTRNMQGDKSFEWVVMALTWWEDSQNHQKSHQNSIFYDKSIPFLYNSPKERDFFPSKWCWLSKQEKNQIEKRRRGMGRKKCFSSELYFFHHKAHEPSAISAVNKSLLDDTYKTHLFGSF